MRRVRTAQIVVTILYFVSIYAVFCTGYHRGFKAGVESVRAAARVERHR